jgi:hypothetical protein
METRDIHNLMSNFGVFCGKEKGGVHETGPLSHGDVEPSESTSVNLTV